MRQAKDRKGLRWVVLAVLGVASVGSSAPASTHALSEVLDEFVGYYIPMQELLAADAADAVARVKERAAKIAAEAAFYASHSADKAKFESLATAAKAMTAADLEGLREQFRGLSRALAVLVEKQPVDGHGIYFCPMADAYWIQKVGEVRNPYYGKFMLNCGAKVEKVDG